MRDSTHPEMREEVLASLYKTPKSLSSKYFYDSVGCGLFQEITGTDEYYLTRCEREILTASVRPILKRINERTIDVIEIGPGDGSKALLIAEKMLQLQQDFNFYGVDICEKALEEFAAKFSSLKDQDSRAVVPRLLIGEFSQIHQVISEHSKNRRLLLFLGSSIGNLSFAQARGFLKEVSGSLAGGDYFLVGFDLKKEEEVLCRAYNDSAGFTAQFNLNLLARLNRELEADFNLQEFYHQEVYDRELGAMASFLVSKKNQCVRIGKAKIQFAKNEKIHTEYSFKYSKEDIVSLVAGSGLEFALEFFDRRKYFTCVLFQKRREAF